MNLEKCPGCLKPGYNTYCTSCRKKLFNGRKVSHVLEFSRPEFNKVIRERSGRLSISGIQVKHSLKLTGSSLELTEQNGEYILKPAPSGQFEYPDQVPANEHLTMQIASQVYKINTAENGLVFFNDGAAAYLTKRFDVLEDGTKLLQEDFAQIAGRTEDTHGNNYKYDYSYEEIGDLIKKHVSAHIIEVEKYFKAVLFNYLFSNGDSHIRNFSLMRNEVYGDYLLTPFYDLISTVLHSPGESDLALELFKGGYMTDEYRGGSKYTMKDFFEFSEKIGIGASRFEKIYVSMLDKTDKVLPLIINSFLREDLKRMYETNYYGKLKRLTPA